MAFNCLESAVSSFLTTIVHVFWLSYVLDAICVPASVSPSSAALTITALRVSSLLSNKPCVPFVLSPSLLLSRSLCLSLGPPRYLLCSKLFLPLLYPACVPSYLPFSLYHFLYTGAVLVIQRAGFSILRFIDNILTWDVVYCFLSEYYEVG